MVARDGPVGSYRVDALSLVLRHDQKWKQRVRKRKSRIYITSHSVVSRETGGTQALRRSIELICADKQ